MGGKNNERSSEMHRKLKGKPIFISSSIDILVHAPNLKPIFSWQVTLEKQSENSLK